MEQAIVTLRETRLTRHLRLLVVFQFYGLLVGFCLLPFGAVAWVIFVIQIVALFGTSEFHEREESRLLAAEISTVLALKNVQVRRREFEGTDSGGELHGGYLCDAGINNFRVIDL